MDMIGLKSKLDNLPVVFVRHLFNNLLQPIMDRTSQYFSSALGTEDDVIEKMVNRMLFVNVVFVHVGEYSRRNISCQQTDGVSTPPLPSNKEGQFIPGMNDRGFPGPVHVIGFTITPDPGDDGQDLFSSFFATPASALNGTPSLRRCKDLSS
jgi:hypothetical protein